MQSRLLISKSAISCSRNQLTIEDKAALSTEIDIFKTVDHPNIVKLYEIFEDDESYSLVMELMTGGEVKKML